MAYLLDITTLAEVLRAAPPPNLVRRLSQVPTRDRWTSVITVSQLLVAARHDRSARLMQEVVRLVAAIRCAPYDLPAAQVFAKLRATGLDLDTDDLMIAAIALSRDLVLVTRRAYRFEKIEGLRTENWIG
jgi:tRNA(fMet)-specific endonuclease VapC